MKMIIRVLLVASLGLTILVLIPDLFLPIATALDTVTDANFVSVFSTIYTVIPDKLIELIRLQLGTLIIIIIIRFVLGGK